jgi:hypothetical protein
MAESGRLGLDLMDFVRGRCAVDGDPPRLYGLGDLANQLDPEQAVVEGRALHLHVVRQAELPFELPGRDAPVQELATSLLGLVAFDGDDVLVGGDGNSSGEKPAIAKEIWYRSSASRSMLYGG